MSHSSLKPSPGLMRALRVLFLLPVAFAAGIPTARAECDPRGGFFAGFAGKYRVDLRTSDTEFEDLLEVRELTRHPGMGNAREEFKGTYTVPERFEVPVEDGVLLLSAVDLEHDVSMTFRIEAAEGGNVYPVYFRFSGSLRDPCMMSGTASFDIDGEVLLGEATLVKLPDGCHCGDGP